MRWLPVVLGSFLLCACESAPSVTQPIQFSHKAHVEKGLPCDGCHQSVERASSAGIPKTDTCMMCHQGTITDSPEEEKVRQYAEKGVPVPWQQVYQVPAHVYFSHRRHVSLGNIKCAQCHGDVADSVVPVTVAAVPVQMDRCLGCHIQKGVTTDCDACHR
jgi:hypothetical protein